MASMADIDQALEKFGKLLEPLRWSTPRTIFVNSMSDLFHEDVPEEYVLAVADVMRLANWHTYQVLTKRATRLRRLLETILREHAQLPHIWWGVSVEDRQYGLPRVAELRAAPTAVRFLSIEPLLEDLGTIELEGIHWVIVGGESGYGARQMTAPWAVSLRDQCRAVNIPFFFKQWGGVQKSKTGRSLEGQIYDEQPPRAAKEIPTKQARHDLVQILERRLLSVRNNYTHESNPPETQALLDLNAPKRLCSND